MKNKETLIKISRNEANWNLRTTTHNFSFLYSWYLIQENDIYNLLDINLTSKTNYLIKKSEIKQQNKNNNKIKALFKKFYFNNYEFVFPCLTQFYNV